MKNYNFLSIILLGITLTSCGDTKKGENSRFCCYFADRHFLALLFSVLRPRTICRTRRGRPADRWDSLPGSRAGRSATDLPSRFRRRVAGTHGWRVGLLRPRATVSRARQSRVRASGKQTHECDRTYKIAHSCIASGKREGAAGEDCNAGVGSRAVGSPWWSRKQRSKSGS